MNNYSVDVTVTSASGEVVYYGKGFSNSKTFKNVELWWPRGLGKPNLYNIEVALSVNDIIDGPRRIDVYRDTFGFRSITIENNSSIFINGRKFYCLGFGMHEDFMVCWALILNQPIQIYNKFLWIHGRGFDRAVMIKDLNLLEWMGANCFRTSHYPYSEGEHCHPYSSL
jgi:beta-glucuronidase